MDNLNNNNTQKLNLLIFEFFSGIGGMHDALKQISSINIQKIFPFDINQNANLTYFENFKIKPNEILIEGFSLNDYENLIQKNLAGNNTTNTKIVWTMSPPCQPFTRQGNMEGLEDNRSTAFIHLIQNIFLKTKNEFLPDYFILENVKNFEISEANKMLCDALLQQKYDFLQFLLSPTDFNIPFKNFILPKKDIKTFLNIENIENDYEKNTQYYLTKSVLGKKSCLSMDISLLKNFSTNCFTKGYTKLFKGTGSILLLDEKLFKQNLNPEDLFGYIRFFTPEEILKFLCFDENFVFPKNLSEKSKYKLLGNSVNVKVVNILMNFLFN